MAFWISTGARASELLGVRQCDIDPGRQLITVVRKGSRAMQQLPVAGDAFCVIAPLSGRYGGQVAPPEHAAAVVDAATTVAAVVLSCCSPNVRTGQRSAQFSAAMRMVRDPQLTLSDVQWVMGHAHLTTTELYLTPSKDEVVAGVLAHHARQAARREEPVPPPPAPGYDPQSLSVLFGRSM